KRAIECLIKCGALDSTGATRKGMLEALPSAQSAGQKAQEDAQLGQGSIFDFGDGAEGGGGSSQAHHRPPISAAEFERRELLAIEKETLGTYLSSHPLSEVRDALRARVDCTLSDLAGKPDGSWVTVGGIVAECKRIRTKSGSQMMFATLDDIEGQVEMLVFKADQAESATTIEPDAVVLVRGRIDHKERGETKLVVQEAERFEPDPEEISRAAAPAEPLRLTIDAAKLRLPGMFDQLKEVFEHHRGEADVHLAVLGEDGKPTEMRLGDGFRVRPSSGLRAELDQILGSADALAA
ncbi:MAG: OB-fold nucleic acid binding domain-containing protein, partial [Gaiellaceae bacterium]